MYVHGAPKRRVGRLGIHDVENAVDDLVAADAEDGGPENLVAVSVNDDFDKPLSFRPSRRRAPPRSLAACQSGCASRLPRLASVRPARPSGGST